MNRDPAAGPPDAGGTAVLEGEPLPSAVEDRTRSSADGWDAAKRRALLYLEGLGAPARQSLEWTLKAMDLAERSPGGLRPAPATIRALRAVLDEPPDPCQGTGPLLASPAPVPLPPPAPGDMPETHLTGADVLGRLLRILRARRARRAGSGEAGAAAVSAPPGSSPPSPSAPPEARQPVRADRARGEAGWRWRRAARLRRGLIGFLILGSTVAASYHMLNVLPHHGGTALEKAITLVFAGLFAWVSIGFWESMGGLVLLLRGQDPFAVAARPGAGGGPPPTLSSRTAVVMPVCDEKVGRLFAGLAATVESLRKTGQAEAFDFFVLSDTRDPDTWVDEETAWRELRRAAGDAAPRVFYRHRRFNAGRKTGNIADFLRRYGKRYAYMIVFDADSVMRGDAIVRLVRAMEENPRAGIIQTAPLAVNRTSLLARVQQFAGHTYAPVQAAGLHVLQLGDSHYWGHNAIVRVDPFMWHCGLPRLPGKPPMGGEILSHDFVEAALMRKAGWEVWLAHDMEGSYEEVPPALHDELKRERRWCQGNLQHLRLVFKRGFYPAHRVLFLHGVLSYVSALLWMLFLALSTAEAVLEAFRTTDYFPVDHALFPAWPRWHPQWAITLLATTAFLLFLPKLLSVLSIALSPRKAPGFGGAPRLLAGMLAEVVFSSLLAPVRMFHHCRFVLMPILGIEASWNPQDRGDHGTSWGEAVRFQAGATLLGLVWASALFLYNRSFFWWNIPVFLPLILSIPLAVVSSSVRLGRKTSAWGLFRIPEETCPPEELRRVREIERSQEGTASAGAFPQPWRRGFTRAVADPGTFHLHRALVASVPDPDGGPEARRVRFPEEALFLGPDVLSPAEKRDLLDDPQTLGRLHRRVWELTDPEALRRWGLL